MDGMTGPETLALMVALPLVGLGVVATAFFLLGRWVRSLRRRGRLHYAARTAPGSDFSNSSSGM